MPSFDRKIAFAAICAISALMLPFPVSAAPSTAKGQISVGQVMEMIAKADSSAIARQTLVAYVAGVGETAGAIADTIGKRARGVSCKSPFRLDAASVRTALETAAPSQASWSQTPATPLIVADMVKRAGCRAED
ncbi:chlorophyllide reductase [Mesorhizobium sp. INR15]|uniref:chlorophyllide reductase n=1 Tax=Mesorhizobium sp. INR15 TaxID=2654248 RepID=UPI00189674C6|nr:chlorophyllide reductase [Mesorhizobium sp. INR15]QPC93244.1 chlorophyllide reductase [Mesorhizobium sp. INR15]